MSASTWTPAHRNTRFQTFVSNLKLVCFQFKYLVVKIGPIIWKGNPSTKILVFSTQASFNTIGAFSVNRYAIIKVVPVGTTTVSCGRPSKDTKLSAYLSSLWYEQHSPLISSENVFLSGVAICEMPGSRIPTYLKMSALEIRLAVPDYQPLFLPADAPQIVKTTNSTNCSGLPATISARRRPSNCKNHGYLST